MASSNSSTVGQILLEWLRERFTGRQREPLPGDENPQGRGFIITMCVFIAIVLWFTLSIRETYTVPFEIPTQVINLPSDEALTTLPPATVQVQVRGEGMDLLGLRFDLPTLLIDAEQDEIDLNTLVMLPQGINAEGVVPGIVRLAKEPRITRAIPIFSRVVVEPAEAYDFFSNPVLSPDSVVVSGARSLIEALAYWPTASFHRAGLKDSLRVMIPLVDTLAGLVSKSQDVTTLTVVASPYTETSRVLRIEPTEVPTTERIVQFDPPTVLVTYRVPLSQYDAAQVAADFYATVPYDRIRSDTTGQVQPTIHRPEDLSLRYVAVSPPAVRYYERLVDP